MKFVLNVTVVFTLLTATAIAEDWPMFRGNPALTGIAQGSLPAKPELLWSFKTQGPVRSSAAIVAGRVFVGSDDGYVYGLDAINGRQHWSFKTGDAVESSPLVLDGRVFVGSSDGYLYALDATNGTPLWKYKTDDKILGAPNWCSSPTNDLKWILVGSYDFRLHCVDAITGTSNWVYESGNYINGSPAVDGGKAVFGGRRPAP